MSFQEKSAWACLVSIVFAFAPYLWGIFQFPMAFVGLLPLAVVVLTLLLMGFHIVNALLTRSIRRTGTVPPLDELDRIIELRAAKLSGIVLAVAVMGWCLTVLYSVPVISAVGVSTNQALIAIHLLFAGFVLANTAYYGSIIAGYRKLADG